RDHNWIRPVLSQLRKAFFGTPSQVSDELRLDGTSQPFEHQWFVIHQENSCLVAAINLPSSVLVHSGPFLSKVALHGQLPRKCRALSYVGVEPRLPVFLRTMSGRMEPVAQHQVYRQ